MTTEQLPDEEPSDEEFLAELKRMGFKPGGVRYDEETGEPFETFVCKLTEDTSGGTDNT